MQNILKIDLQSPISFVKSGKIAFISYGLKKGMVDQIACLSSGKARKMRRIQIALFARIESNIDQPKVLEEFGIDWILNKGISGDMDLNDGICFCMGLIFMYIIGTQDIDSYSQQDLLRDMHKQSMFLSIKYVLHGFSHENDSDVLFALRMLQGARQALIFTFSKYIPHDIFMAKSILENETIRESLADIFAKKIKFLKRGRNEFLLY